MSDDESKLTRREFVKFSAMTSLTAGGLYALTTKSDILAQDSPPLVKSLSGDGSGISYIYIDGMP